MEQIKSAIAEVKSGATHNVYMKILIILAISCFIFGCSSASDSAKAQKLVENFHVAMNNRDFDSIYNNLTDEKKKEVPRDQFIESLTKVRKSFGEYKDSQLVNTDFKSYISGADNIALTYRTRYDSVVVKEKFTFQRSGKNDLLLVFIEWNIWA